MTAHPIDGEIEMSLAEGVQVRVAYKAYSTGVITANTEAVSSSDLAVTGGQTLRRISSTLKLAKATYSSNEILSSRQVQDFRHGGRSVTGGINGDYSPGTYFDFIEAATRGTKVASVATSNTDFTSVAASASGSTFTFASGDPVVAGYGVGDIVRFSNMSSTTNNATNFVVLSFSTGSNRVMTVFPAPTDQAADSTFNMTSNGASGHSVSIPSTGHVSRKFGFEHYFNDLDFHNLFTECRIGGVKWTLPASGMSTFDVTVMGRDMETASAASSPFFTGPTAATSTGIFAAVNGLLRVGGSTVGVVTGLTIDLNLSPTTTSVVGQNFAPEIFLGSAKVTGQMTALLDGSTLISDFVNESEIDILAYLTTTSAVNSPANTIYLPRVKLGDAPVGVTGEGGQIITMPFTALLYGGTTPGVPATTIRVCDSEAS
jgi:hypothetical protein